MESRKNNVKATARLSRAADLPVDFTRIVREVYTTNFNDGLKALKKLKQAKSAFEVRGAIFTDEIVMAVSLVTDGEMPATTIHCSVDFDPTASSPNAQDLLNVCVDAIGSLYGTLLDPAKPDRLAKVAENDFSGFEEIPLEWTKVEFDGRRVYLLVDKSNPTLDEMTDKWLAENDPDADLEEDEFDEEAEGNFVTGKNRSGRGGPLH